jgi:hypothetical protein
MSTLVAVFQMSALRQRFFHGRRPSQDKANVDSGSTTSHTHSGSTGRWRALLCAVSLSVIFLMYRRFATTESGTASPFYAICSRDGPWIYTVDRTDNRTQCLVVRGSVIADTGTLGTLLPIFKNLNLWLNFSTQKSGCQKALAGSICSFRDRRRRRR